MIKNTNKADCFAYIDPPYPDTDQYYENKFTKEDFNNLLKALKDYKGKFMLSCYLKDWMCIEKDWCLKHKNTIMHLHPSLQTESSKKRVETIIMNYKPVMNYEFNYELLEL